MQGQAGASTPASGRSSPQLPPINEADPFFRKSINIPFGQKIKVVVVEEHNLVIK